MMVLLRMRKEKRPKTAVNAASHPNFELYGKSGSLNPMVLPVSELHQQLHWQPVCRLITYKPGTDNT